MNVPNKSMFSLLRDIRDCRIATSTDLLVLDKIALRLNFKEETLSCHPSYRKLKEDTRLAISTIKASVGRLKKRGYLKVRNRANTSNVFYVQYDFIAAEAAQVRVERKQAVDQVNSRKWELEQHRSVEFLANPDAQGTSACGLTETPSWVSGGIQ